MASPGEDVQAWSKTAATNANADPLINWAENQPRASVNNSARSQMAAHAKDRDLKNGSITTGGSANAQTFTSGVGYTAPIPTGLCVRLKIGFTNSGDATLNMDSIGAVQIRDHTGTPLTGNQMIAGRYGDFLYDGTYWILLQASVTATPLDALAYNGMQINGSGDVDQAVAGNIIPASGVMTYFTDGWCVQNAGAATVLASPLPAASFPASLPGFGSCVRIYTATAAGALGASDYTILATPIEGYRVARLGWGSASAQPITISFWVCMIGTTVAPATITLAVVNGDNTRRYLANAIITATNVWEYKTITIPGDTTGTWLKTNGLGMRIYFCTGAGSSLQTAPNVWTGASALGTSATSNFNISPGNQVAITGLAVLPGSNAPPYQSSALIMRSYDQELPICKRYYEQSWIGPTPATQGGCVAAVWSSANRLVMGGKFSVEKRVTPTWQHYSPAGGGAGVVWIPGVVEFAMPAPTISASGWGGAADVGGLPSATAALFNWKADARL